MCALKQKSVKGLLSQWYLQRCGTIPKGTQKIPLNNSHISLNCPLCSAKEEAGLKAKVFAQNTKAWTTYLLSGMQ